MNRIYRRLAVLTAPLVLLAACASGTTDTVNTSPIASGAPMDTTVGAVSDSRPDATVATDGDHGDDHKQEHGTAGTAPTSQGFTLKPQNATFDAGYSGEFAFTIVTEGTQTVVTRFEAHHEKLMHLILVNHDLTEYLHLHPEMDAGGVWTTTIAFPVDGFWRVVTDFVSDGKAVLLGTDVVSGTEPMRMANLTEEVRIAQSGPYTAEIFGDTAHEGPRPLKVTFSRAGTTVAAVNPYLGANAHMVAFSRALEYVHMHPNDGFVEGTMTFTAPALEHGSYKLFLQADFDGEIRLFEFIIEAK